eukprot:GEMP01034203.1.p1 GENE.GEMP01034203.1~~GEMP01034203.1.p1  ORF type:complete len:339 (+),score=47.73 GEMP01034203.1:264-1280(+)
MYFGQGVREPKLDVTHVARDMMQFTLRSTDTSMANNLRRCMLAEVPTMAIETVTVHENSSVLFDEFICHRLGLIPLYSEDIGDTVEESGRAHPGTFNMTRDCDCHDAVGCQFCTVEYELDVYNAQSHAIDVTHLDIRLKQKREDRIHQILPMPTKDDSLSWEEDVRRNGIKIVRLGKNQHVKFHMTAVKNTSKSHAKFNPTGTVFYRFQPDIRFNTNTMAKLSLEEKEEIVESCASKVYELDMEEIKIARLDNCTFCDDCVFVSKELGYRFLISVQPVPDVFHFTVEAVGSRSAPDIVQAALRSYTHKLHTGYAYVEEVHEARNRKAIAYDYDEKIQD